MSGIYIHIPFCKRKCIYCDFYSVGERLAEWKSLIYRYLQELDSRKNEWPQYADTIYLGGGTPSLMPQSAIALLIDELKKRGLFSVQTSEITIEINPDDVTTERVKMWQELGFNRFSIGIQSFDDTLLQKIGRRHSARQAIDATLLLRDTGNISIDLMFALPQQSFDSWQSTIQTALQLQPQHISAYALMYEEGTPLTKQRDNGKIQEATDEVYLHMFSMLTESLKRAGYIQYEISNYCLPGYESRHNSSYWSGKPYIGIGPSAHSYDGICTRRANPACINQYMTHNFQTPFYQEEHLNIDELAEEYLLTRLRTLQGIELRDFHNKFPHLPLTVLTTPLKRTELVKIENGYLHLTNEGIMNSDSVILEIASRI